MHVIKGNCDTKDSRLCLPVLPPGFAKGFASGDTRECEMENDLLNEFGEFGVTPSPKVLNKCKWYSYFHFAEDYRLRVEFL